MTNKIQQLVSEISQKQQALKEKMMALKAENEKFAVELEQVKNENQELKGQIEGNLTTISDLRNELATEKIQVVEKTVVSTKRNDEQIDELVKEIEFCINQLKNNE